MNIFIVEDEYWALEELKALLNKYNEDHSLFFFEDGEEAYNNAALHPPDLIITDITMPMMNGIDLINKVKKVYPLTECVLLTVHDTFDYAKKAIDLEVSEYLLKPVKRETLYNMMNRLLKKIENRKMQEIEQQLWSINQLIVNQKEDETGRFAREELIVTYLLLGNWQANAQNSEQILQKLENFNKQTGGWLLPLDEQRILWLNNGKMVDIPYMKQIFKTCKESNQVHFCTLKKEKNQKLIAAYQQADQLMRQSKLFGTSTFITDHQQERKVDISTLWDYARILEKSLRNNEFHSMDKPLNLLVEQIEWLQPTQQILRQFLLDMYYAIWFKLEQHTSNTIKIQHVDSHFAKLDTFTTFGELKIWLTHLIELVAKSLLNENVAPKQLIPMIKDFVEKNYAENITFQQFANEHHVSLSYLSREFKLQTKMTFSEYLTNYRITKAKELFENGFTKTVEVGVLVGYQDPKHFRSIFKKRTKLTPREYKQLHQQTKNK